MIIYIVDDILCISLVYIYYIYSIQVRTLNESRPSHPKRPLSDPVTPPKLLRPHRKFSLRARNAREIIYSLPRSYSRAYAASVLLLPPSASQSTHPSHSSSSPPCMNAVRGAPEPQNFPRLAGGAKPPAAGPVRRPKLWRPTPFLSRRLSFSVRTCTTVCYVRRYNTRNLLTATFIAYRLQ